MSLQIGDIRIDSVLEYEGLYRTPEEMYPLADAALVDRHRGWMEPHYMDPESGRMIIAFRSFLVRTGRLTILVDGCVGNDKNRPLRPEWHHKTFPWMDNLRARGVAPEDVDVVMCTHLHVDHVGWNTRLENGRWVPTFPNARYLFHEKEYAFWEEAHAGQDWIRDAFEDSVLPVVSAGRADMVKADHEIDHGLVIEPSPGHTPGHVSLSVVHGGDAGVLCGDLMHHPLQISEPQLSTIFCSDPAQSAATRAAFVERHADTGTMVLPAHFRGAGTGGGCIVGNLHGGRPGFRALD